MSAQPWGRTGRVTLRAGDQVADVRVDGVRVGFVSPQRGGGCSAVSSQSWRVQDLPTRDAAVMWVLRRTAPDVWRAERPVVARVGQMCTLHPGRLEAWVEDLFIGAVDYFGLERLVAHADRYAREKVRAKNLGGAT